MGNVLVETDLAGNNPTEYIFFNGKRVARRGSDTLVHYYISDHLGSARIVTDAFGNMSTCGSVVSGEDESDYFPFGGERVICDRLANQNYKFTGQERDSESGLDYFGARFYTSNFGRFTSPDIPLLDQFTTNPQSWNLYAYGRNNPLNGTDPTGRVWKILQYSYKIAKAAYKGEDIYSTVKGVVDGTKVVFSMNASVGVKDRLKATASVLGELSGVSDAVKGAKKLGKAAGVAEDAKDTQKKLPDDALVVRGGQNTPESFVKAPGATVDSSGKLDGVSVNSAPGKSVEQLSEGIPHNKVGVTTVGEVRAAGGDVVPSPTDTNPNHCTLCGITPEEASKLMKVQENPVKHR